MLSIKKYNDVFVARFEETSKFNHIISQQIKEELNEVMNQPEVKLILDFHGIVFIDSSAFGTLISVLKTSKLHNGEMILCNINPEVLDLFEVMQLHTIFLIYPTLEEALAKY